MTSEERREARYQRRKRKRLESKDRQRKPYDDFETYLAHIECVAKMCVGNQTHKDT